MERAVTRFITSAPGIAAELLEQGFFVAGTLDEQIPLHEVYVAYSDRQMRRVGEYVARKLCWNVRIRSESAVTSLGWYGSPDRAIREAEHFEDLIRQHESVSSR